MILAFSKPNTTSFLEKAVKRTSPSKHMNDANLLRAAADCSRTATCTSRIKYKRL